MTTMSSALDFVFSNLISGTYSGSSITFAPDGNQLLFPQGNRLTFFDVSRGQSITHELEHPATITLSAISPCGRYIITADRQNYVFLSEVGVGGFIYQKRFKHPITAAAFGPNGFALASANKLTLYKHPSEVTPLKPFVSNKRVGGHYEAINYINFSPDGRFFTTCSGDMTIRVFMTEPDEEFVPLTLAGHRGKPIFATFTSNDIIQSLGADGSFFVWHIESDYSITIVSKRRLDEEDFENPKNRFQNITAAAFNGDSLVAGFANGSFKTYAIPNHQLNIKSSNTVSYSTERVRTASISNKYAAFTSQKLGELVVWDLQSGSVAQRTMSHFGGVTCFDYSPNGVVVATGGDDGKLKIWDTQTGSCLMTFDEHQASVTDVVFGESGRTVITSSLDGSCKAFDIVRGRCFRTFNAPEHVEFTKIAVDTNFDFIAACGRGTMSIFLWSVATGKLLEELTGHTGPVSSIKFTQLGKLVSGSWDGTCRVWDFLDSQSSIAYEARGEVTDVAVSPDGKLVCMSNSNGRILIYELANDNYVGEISASLDARGGKRLDGERSSKNTKWFFDSIDFSPDSSYLVCGGKSKFICIYNVKAQLLMRRISHTVNTEFSGVEGYVKEYHGSGLAQQIMDAKLGKRAVIEAAANQVKWCPTGRGIAAATPEGLIIFVSADQRIVDPLELETDITPAAVEEALAQNEFVKAVVMSIRLGHSERKLLLSVITHVPANLIEFVANHIPTRFGSDFLQFLAEALRQSNQVELIMKWILATLKFHSHKLLKDPSAVPAAHLLQKSLSTRIELTKKMARENLDLMNFLCEQPDPTE
ncbi:Periodic tryptophan protein 2 like protein-related protein [Tritrichomonas foetus]|uniref:Periodic tryptophan protein 2 like protein-related protein n=1 Tax=Tritrichomonas foetus TaxID=1144522 RepID=A0A1J4L1D4_9EUKA|nr:Periodic tryptophan protein 2 like protein-related protein [Tritrichomonas foetus]|eukprot:OHT17251.1 Periodic tryptophan protein 2 like protein-related protein [Tritrichomonas foetus]